MEVGTFSTNKILTWEILKLPRLPFLPSPALFSRSHVAIFPLPPLISAANFQRRIGCKLPKAGSDSVAEWVSNNDETTRRLPVFVGGASLLAVLVNRAISGIPPVADASSSQSRADLLTLGLAVTNILAGLVWISIRPRPVAVVDPEGVECRFIHPRVPDAFLAELTWTWESLLSATCCRSLVIVYDSICILQFGIAAAPNVEGEAAVVDASTLAKGSLYQNVMKSNAQSYLANLSLYPGKSELPFLPPNTQAVILQPLGDRGIAVIGGNIIRGFTTSDQAWISYVGEKLDAMLSELRQLKNNDEPF